MRATTLFQAVLAIAMFSTGCSGDPSGDGHSNTDVGTNPTGSATVELDFSIRGNSEECQLYGDGEPIGATNQVWEIDPGTYEFTAGSDDTFSSDGLPLHPFDGMNWGCTRRPADTLENGDSLVIPCEANVVFSGDFACTRKECVYDESTSDGMGSPCNAEVPDPVQHIEVIDGYRVKSEIDGFNTFSNEDDLIVEGDRLGFVGDEDVWILDSIITASGFEAHIVANDDVTHLKCSK